MIFQGKWITAPRFAGAYKGFKIYHRYKDDKDQVLADQSLNNDHTWFGTRFAAKAGASYRMRISGDDYYKLYVNGTFAAQGPASSYVFAYHYNEIDITPYLHAGENVLSVHVYYHGRPTHVGTSGDAREGLIADLFENGSFLLGTDENWICQRSDEFLTDGMIGYETNYRENLDFRKKNVSAVLLDGGEWQKTAVDPDHGHVFTEEPTPTLSVYRMRPASIFTRPDGIYIDMGQEICGQIALTAKGAEGSPLTVLFGEELSENDPTMVRYQSRCCGECKCDCVLSGGEDVFDFYDYTGFRYVNLVFGDNVTVDPETIFAVVRHYPFNEACGRLPLSDEKLKTLWEFGRNTVKYSTQENFLDCPTREKGQYLGDFTVSGLAHLYMTGDPYPYRKSMQDFASSLAIIPGMSAVAPGCQEIADFSLQYPLQVLRYVGITGDTKTLHELLPAVKAIIRYFMRFINADGLLVNALEKWNLVDWPTNLRDGYDYPPEDDPEHYLHNVVNGHWIGALICTEKLCGMAGDTEIPMASAPVIRAYEKTFYDPSCGLYADRPLAHYKEAGITPHFGLHASILPAFYGYQAEGSREPILAMIREKGLCCGVQFAYFVLKACAMLGDKKLEYDLLTGDGEHSWFNMLREGATTTYEAWGKDQKWNTSLCHPWALAPVIVIAEDMVGDTKWF